MGSRSSIEPELPRLDNSAYTVGWITALHHELAASKVMLDTRHQSPSETGARDTSQYILGSINGLRGEHNVVITCLPAGVPGTTAAATAATNMLSSFPAIKFGLMVGIGGGIWSDKNNMRLGDVVVSTAWGTAGGVLSHGVGKQTTDGFEVRGHLNSPPVPLLAAVNILRATHDIEVGKIPRILEGMLQSFPRMAGQDDEPGFIHQGENKDCLFKSDYVHRVSSPGRDHCAACDEEQKVKRRSRPLDPKIHYGVIASGDIIMTDAKKRDLEFKDCLCIETEAAGLMNNFPCLVIRGMSDYCDSHKSDVWQKYAAATAAAYAKELLGVTQPGALEKSKSALEAMKVITTMTQETLQKTIEDRQAKEKKKALKLMTEVEYITRYGEILDERCEGTGQWLLDSEEFISWKRSEGAVLVCLGIPGAGKTVISATVIRQISRDCQQNAKAGLAYLFCEQKRKGEQTAKHLLSSILQQLCRRPTTLPPRIKDIYKLHSSLSTRVEKEELIESLQLISKEYAKIFIIIDALDECEPEEQALLIQELYALNQSSGVNILVTSREDYASLQEFKNRRVIKIEAMNQDIIQYFRSKQHKFNEGVLCQKGSVDQELLEDIQKQVCSMAQSMFLLAKLSIDTLCQSPNKKACKELLETLASLGAGQNLQNVYQKTLEQVKDEKHCADLAKQALAWLVLTDRQFSTTELLHFLAVKMDTTRFDYEDMMAVELIKKACGTFITVNDKRGTIRLVHATAQDFLADPKQEYLQGMHAYLAKVCLTYLLYDCFHIGISLSVHDDEPGPGFYAYPASRWGYHLGHALIEPSAGNGKLDELRERFLQTRPPSPAFQYWSSRLTRGLVLDLVFFNEATCLDLVFSPSKWGCLDAPFLSNRHIYTDLYGISLVLTAFISKSLEWSRARLAPCTHPEHWQDLDSWTEDNTAGQCQLDENDSLGIADLKTIENVLAELVRLVDNRASAARKRGDGYWSGARKRSYDEHKSTAYLDFDSLFDDLSDPFPPKHESRRVSDLTTFGSFFYSGSDIGPRCNDGLELSHSRSIS